LFRTLLKFAKILIDNGASVNCQFHDKSRRDTILSVIADNEIEVYALIADSMSVLLIFLYFL
jgi:hypothetical protein